MTTEKQKLSKRDIDLLKRENRDLLLVGAFGFAAFFILICVFNIDLLFGAKSIEMLIGWFIVLTPVIIILFILLFRNLDLLLGYKIVITGKVDNIDSFYSPGEAGSMDNTWYYVFIEGKKFTVSEKEFKKVYLGKRVALHRTVFSKKVFLIE